ncbi:hypothetical protein D3C87_128590 [compost metagenome]
MKTIFDKATAIEIIDRINTLNSGSKREWGKMNLFQMLKHCVIWTEWVMGKNNYKYKQEFIGYLFGKIVLKGIMKDDRIMKRGMPAGRDFEVRENGDNIELQKRTLINLIQGYECYSNSGFIHDFFGKMTREQIGVFAYKHYDHHLRQFGS